MSTDCRVEADQWEFLPERPDVSLLRPDCDCTGVDESWWSYLREGERRYLLGPRDWPRDRCAWCGGFLIHSEMCRALRDSWNTMPFGKHKGEPLRKVESTYLAWVLSKTDDKELQEKIREELRGRDLGGTSDGRHVLRANAFCVPGQSDLTGDTVAESRLFD